MIDVSGWRKRQLALEKKADNARELGLGYGCAECGADGGTALYCVACAEKYVSKGTRMTDEEIHNIYLHMSGKAEGLVEATGKADFPVMFARAILEYEGLTKDAQNMASKSTYKEQLEIKDQPVAWEQFHEHMAGPNYVAPQRTWVGLTDEEKAQFVVAYYPSNWDRKTAVSLMSDYEKYLKEKNNV